LPVLKKYSGVSGAQFAHTAITAITPASRALVISKLVVVVATGSSASFHLSIGATGGGNNYIATNLAITNAQNYTETGLIVPAGEYLWLAGASTGTGVVSCVVFGEEVDN
jgi:hypothetical protein